MRLSTNVVRAVALGAALGCGGGSTGPTYGSGPNPSNPTPPGSTSSTNTITVGNNSYTPDNTTIPPGTSVTWKWDSCGSDGYGGQTCMDHSVTFSDGAGSATQSSGTYSRAFASPGTYVYHCAIHGTYMTGTIIVK